MVRLLVLAVILLAPVLSAEVAGPSYMLPEGSCVRDAGWMKKNHMDLLNHDRDQTVRLGQRGKHVKGSLKQCINCHVSKDHNGEYPKISSDRHFCSSCHLYAAVKPDCFECHASKPDEVASHE